MINSKVLSAGLLIAGTSIGAGMLALPLKTLPLGGLTAMLVLLTVALIMWLAADLLLEVCLKHHATPTNNSSIGLNIITLASKLGFKRFDTLIWLVMLIFLYALMSAYTSGGSEFLIKGLRTLPSFLRFTEKIQALDVACMTMFVLFFGGIVTLGTKIVDAINKIALLILALSFLSLLYIIWWHTKKTGIHWQPEITLADAPFKFVLTALKAFSIVITSFGFHLLIPSLTHYLNKDPYHLKRAITMGCSLVYLVYLAWILSIFRVIPQNSSFKNEGVSVVAHFLQDQSPHAALSIGLFSFMALLTSFLGVALGLVDFLADGLKINKNTQGGKIKLFTLAFLPPLVYTIIQPSGFLMALQYGGIFSAILLIALPAYLHYKTFGPTPKSIFLFLIASTAIIAANV